MGILEAFTNVVGWGVTRRLRQASTGATALVHCPKIGSLGGKLWHEWASGKRKWTPCTIDRADRGNGTDGIILGFLGASDQFLGTPELFLGAYLLLGKAPPFPGTLSRFLGPQTKVK